jgi:hypothetical protein
LLEVTGREIRAAQRAVVSAGLEGVRVHRFGDRLHVVYDTADQEAEVRRDLSGLGVEVEPVEPGIEDAFVRLVTVSREGRG